MAGAPYRRGGGGVSRWRQCATGVLWSPLPAGERFLAVGPLRGGGFLAEVRLIAQGAGLVRVPWGVVLSGGGGDDASAFECGESLIQRSTWGQFHGQPAGYTVWAGVYATSVVLPVWRRVDSGSRYVVLGCGMPSADGVYGVLVAALVVSEV
jgi:hypothetical protein